MADSDATDHTLESRFKAFVSYSHADKAAARKLHRKLETYRLPKYLRELEGSTINERPTGERIGPIFRDREDLPAAEDLSESVKKALSVSEALIVLCSPDAQKSPWVAREIELFRELHPGRPVLAAILRGEPEEAFPEPLKQGREPLAADLRREGDGPRLGFLKIVAGIAGVPLDALINRDAQRRVRRVTAITAAAVAAMVVMALMTTFALQARNEAQTQREGAEDVIEFMMTDLRTDLRGVGRLDVMESVNKRAIRFYEDQGDTSDLPVDSALRWARILHALGEDKTITAVGEGVDFEAAGALFEQANGVTQQLLEDSPDDPARVYTHAQSQFWLGYDAYLQKNYEATAKYWIEYDRLATKLRDLGSNDYNGLREMGFAQGNLCTLALEDADALSGRAVDFCARSLDYMQGVWQTNRDKPSKLDLVNRLSWYSRALELDEDADDSPEMYYRALQITDELLEADPDNRDYQEVWLTLQTAAAKTDLSAGKLVAASQRLNLARDKIVELVEADQSNSRWRARMLEIEQISKAMEGKTND
ncbi:toll/interleukin-1 receptor domain-containing protein [Pontixanthobacter aestiaquae]|uniref:TIR domain-containing protein n=1 Tax=Pontixanthobacter aestiaquae TaxID=1509367 RepID=A0A844Z7A0_9SPHN|nr:toll/interleukin-1 receptor domain-containing protein [Pontixanthobacter aestiaquae]MDN3647235.1 toll/interleukin-1 receptor domain-containing protein [Pontixanthobacter aestiaquae]MXO81789.1 TIR domain-containing protein [Pontixanthobacter aestiaquae]